MKIINQIYITFLFIFIASYSYSQSRSYIDDILELLAEDELERIYDKKEIPNFVKRKVKFCDERVRFSTKLEVSNKRKYAKLQYALKDSSNWLIVFEIFEGYSDGLYIFWYNSISNKTYLVSTPGLAIDSTNLLKIALESEFTELISCPSLE